MCSQLGSAIIVIPLIAILESVAIAKAFGKLYFHYISMYCILFSLNYYYYAVVGRNRV